MIEQFRRYLIEQGYSQETPSGKPSTVDDYSKRVQKICERENKAFNELAGNISHYVEKYGALGSEAEFGRESHHAYINALRRFEDFINSENSTENK